MPYLSLQFAWIPLAAVAVGLFAWVWWVRRRDSAVLTPGARLGLVVLLIALVCCNGRLNWAAAEFLNNRVLPGDALTRTVLSRLDLAMPASASFHEPDIRPVDDHAALMLLPPAQLEWLLDQSVKSVELTFGFHPLASEQTDGNGADFSLELTGKAYPRVVLTRHLDPAREARHRGPQHATLSLPAFEPGARLILRTDPGKGGNNAWDWLYLSHFRLVKASSYSTEQFPGFNRVPTRATGDTTSPVIAPSGQSALYLGTPTTLEFRLDGTERRLAVAYCFMPGAYRDGGRTDGAVVRIELKTRGKMARLFEYHAVPATAVADRELLHGDVALPAHDAHSTLVVSFLPGPNGDGSWDQIYIERFVLE